MTKKFYKVCENDLIYRVNILRNENSVTLETEVLEAALDVKTYDDNTIKLFCHDKTHHKNIIITLNCDVNDTQKYVYDDAGMLKSFITTTESKIIEFIKTYRDDNPELNIIVNDDVTTE